MRESTLLRDIETFLVDTGMKDSTFGRLALRDWKLINGLRSGRRIFGDTETRIRAFMAGYDRQAAPRPAVCQVCSQHLTDVTLRSCINPGCPYVGSDLHEIHQGGMADRGQGAGSSPLSTSQPVAAGAATAARKPAGTQSRRKAA